MRARRYPSQARQTGIKPQRNQRKAKKPDEQSEGRQFADDRGGWIDINRCRGNCRRGGVQRVEVHGYPKTGGVTECSEMPRGKQQREEWKRGGAENRNRPNMMPEGRGTPAQCDGDGPRTRQEYSGFDKASQKKLERNLRTCEQAHGQLSFRPFTTRRARRSNSSGETRETSPPRRAATTFSVEPSKKVSTRWRRAERRATSRGMAGRKKQNRPSSPWGAGAFSFPKRHGGRTGG